MKLYDVPKLYTEVLDAWTILYDDDPIKSERQWINIGIWDAPSISYEEACDQLATRLFELAELNSADSILDVGCGTGTSCRLFSDTAFTREKMRPHITGVNITPEHIAVAERLTDTSRYGESISYRLADATQLDMFENDRFTKVTALECAFHFQTRELFLKEAFRLLKPGGILAMADILVKPSTPTFDKWSRFLPEALIRPLFEKPSRYMAMPLENQVTISQLRKTLSSLGFRQISIENINPLTRPFRHHYKKKMKAYLRGNSPPWLPSYEKKHIAVFKRKMDFTALTLRLADYVLVKAMK